jgi:L-ascorbate metabolism protein UlaG (beta-lactamase superfamily)
MKATIITVFLTLILSSSSAHQQEKGEEAISIEEVATEKLHHLEDGSFFNPWCADCSKSFLDLLKWRLSRNAFREERKKEVRLEVERPDFPGLFKRPGDYIVWLGHSTVLMRVGKMTIITDPVFWDVNFLIRRKTPLPVEPEKLPRIDYVLVSHNHYDHLNTRSIEFLKERFDPFFVTGPGYEDYFASIGTSKHIVLDWWQKHEADGIRIISLPAHHWSKRGFFDTNSMLWCSFLIEREGVKYYWVGDSGYYSGYREIGGKFGPVDVLLVPIGGYEPRWFMKTYHVNPEEAVEVARDVRAKTFIPIHWGTFDLTDEPLWFPIEHLKEIYKGGKGPALEILNQGGTFFPVDKVVR